MSQPNPESIPFSSIIEGDRARDKTKYGDLDGLCASLKSLGTIQPIVLSRSTEGRYELIAGGRRYKALSKNKVPALFHGSVLDPARPGFVFADEVPEHVRLEAELDENLHRLNMDWIDSVLLGEKIHMAKKAKDIKWGIRQTAALLGKGFGKSNVGYILVAAKALRAGDKEVLACKTMMEVVSVFAKRKEDEALAELQRRATLLGGGPKIVAPGMAPQSLPMPPTGEPTSFIDVLRTELGPKKTFSIDTTVDPLKAPTEVLAKTPTAIPEVPLSQMFRLGDSLKVIMPSYPDACFNHIVTDIPYGIDTDNMTDKGKADIADQHDVESNAADMPVFLDQAYRLVKPGGFCVFFYDLDYHERLQAWALDIGWKVQRWPLIWVKTHNCANQASGFNYTKTIEYAMVLRRDESSVLRKAQNQCHWIGDGSAERKLYNNKFAKPQALWRELIYDAIAFPGQSVYDPYVGEGSASRAAANMGLLPYGSEISEVHYNRLVPNMQAIYALIHKSNVKFT